MTLEMLFAICLLFCTPVFFVIAIRERKKLVRTETDLNYKPYDRAWPIMLMWDFVILLSVCFFLVGIVLIAYHH